MDAETKDDYGTPGQQWRDAIELAGKGDVRKWEEQGEKVVKRYRDERSAGDSETKKFNILWSNVETIKPALYARTPKPQVSRRFKQKDELGKNASMVLERSLAFASEAYDFDDVMKSVVEDYVLPGRGMARVRYVPQFAKKDEGETVEYEECQCEYHFWRDIRHGPGRKWVDVPWLAFRHYLDKETLIQYFGEDKADKITLDHPKNDDNEQFKKAVIWEIWSKKDNKVHWLAWSQTRVVASTPPPLKLHGFFPSPKPLYSLVTNDKLIPVSDYVQYQDQADELDQLSARIGILVQAIRVVGIYSADTKDDLSNIMLTGTENKLYPVDAWAALAEKGGLRGTIEYLPLDQIISVVQGLYEARDRTKQELYEITGLSDILRGASNPNETATAQRLKGQFGTLRLDDRQKHVANFARDLFRLKAEVICENFSLETLQMITGLEFPPDMWAAIYDLLRSDPMRTFRIDIETESTLQADEQADKEARIEFVQGMTGFMQQSAQMIQADQKLLPIVAEMMMFAVRGFRAGRELEDVFETAMEEMTAAPEDMTADEQQAAQAEQEKQQLIEQAQMRREMAEITNIEGDAALKQIDAQERQLSMQLTQAKMQVLPLEAQKLQAETGKITADTGKVSVETQVMTQKPGEAPIDPIDRELDRGEKLAKVKNLSAEAEEKVYILEERRQALEAEKARKRPKKIEVHRDEDGVLRGEVTDSNGDITHAEVKRDENGNLVGSVGSTLKYNPLTGAIGVDNGES